MQEKELRMLFNAGSVSKASAVYVDIQGGYILAFQVKNQKQPVYLETQRTGQRVAKTLDAAAEAIRRVGFKEFTVEYI